MLSSSKHYHRCPLLYPCQPSCSPCLFFCHPLPPFSLSIYLSFFFHSACFITSPFSSTVCTPFSVYFLLSPYFSLFMSLSSLSVLFSLSFFLSVSFSPSLAVINRSLVGCWSVRNGRSDGFSQLLQAFPGSPHRNAFCGPGFQTCRQNIQNMNSVLNIWTALMCAWFILLNRPTSEHISCNNKINQVLFFKQSKHAASSGFAEFIKHFIFLN